MIKKLASIFIATALLCSALPVNAIPYGEYMDGREEYASASYKISPGLTYTETLTKNAKYGYERAYVYEYTPSLGTEIIPSCGDYVYGTESLGTLTKALEKEGKRVVGGINGDFYSTTTGVPIGAMIVDGEIITSDNERTAMGFDKDGNAFISKPTIVTTLKNDENDINIEHINKYPLEYCLYLLTDRFYPTTKTGKASYEIVLMPYSESVTYLSEEEMNTPDDKAEEDSAEGEEIAEEEYVYIYPVTEEETQELEEQTEVAEAAEDPEVPETVEETEEAENTGETTEETTDVADETNEEQSEEVTEETEAPEETEVPENPEFYAKRYTFADEKIKIGSEIKVVVTEIRKDSINSKIPEGCFVLCAENELQSDRVKNLFVGSELTLSVTADEQWYGAVNAIGNSGGLILKDGEYVDDVEIDHYPYAHPRTAAGITADGRVIFYCVDGRQNTSGGLRIDQLSHEMKKLGCVIAMNLDGGGSTTAYAALPGEFFSTLKNSPSVTPERRTANSLLFVNTTERLDEIEHFSMFPEKPYVLSGGSRYTLPSPVATDANFHPISLSNDIKYEYFTTSIGTDSYVVDGNIFVSGEKSGTVNIYIRVGEGEDVREFRAGHIFVLDTPQEFMLGEAEYEISPFESIKLDFKADYHDIPLYYSPDSIRWSVGTEKQEISEDEETETTEETGKTEEIYLSVENGGAIETDKLTISPELEITPKTHGETILLKAKLGELEKEIKLSVMQFPFTDSFEHWSAKNLYTINSYGLMKGEPDGEGFAFFPQRNLTKAEFLTVLARMLYPDIDNEAEQQNEAETDEAVLEEETLETQAEETAEEVVAEEAEETEETFDAPEESEELETAEPEQFVFADDAEIPQWAKKYFDALGQSGLLQLVSVTDENGNVYINANKNITRLEVLVLLGALSDEAMADFVGAYTDTESIYSSEHFAFINNALSAGIFEGYEDGSLRAENDLTRAESATVILRFLDKKATE